MKIFLFDLYHQYGFHFKGIKIGEMTNEQFLDLLHKVLLIKRVVANEPSYIAVDTQTVIFHFSNFGINPGYEEKCCNWYLTEVEASSKDMHKKEYKEVGEIISGFEDFHNGCHYNEYFGEK